MLATSAIATGSFAASGSQPSERTGGGHASERDPRQKGPVAIASANGLGTVELAHRLMSSGVDPALAAVDGVALVEADPNDMSVGLGGLPNEMGVVTLDAAVMHGPTHKAGAVAALEDTVHAAAVALKVLQTTDHVLIVGEGARRFARMHGFPEADLLTAKAREAWLRWKQESSKSDDWLDLDEMDWSPDGSKAIPRTTGTIHCSCVTDGGDIGCCTTTSGLSYKIPGRVGDSPIIGAGLFCDNDVGSAGCTGRGEAAMQSLAAYSTVRHMEAGRNPTEAALAALDEVARRSRRQRRLVDDADNPNFQLKIYALRKDGAFGSANMRPGNNAYAVCDAAGARLEKAAIYAE